MIESSRYVSLSEFDPSEYDGFVFSAGTEIRSVQLFSDFFKDSVSSAAYLHNHRSFFDEKASEGLSGSGLSIEITGGSLFREGQASAFRSFLAEKESILVDVSCMTRSMMAEQVLYLSEYAGPGRKVEFAYLPSLFSPPSKAYPKIRRIGAASPHFSGYNFRPGDPVALAMGLGHEFGVAIGIINQIEPRMAVCFRSVGIDERFDSAVKDANFGFDFSPYSASVVDVNITRPESAYSVVENVFSNLISDHRLIVVPSGPKIFSLICFLAALRLIGKVAIYRVEHARLLAKGARSQSIITCRMSDEFGVQDSLRDWRIP
jgi:hypothetical protein